MQFSCLDTVDISSLGTITLARIALTSTDCLSVTSWLARNSLPELERLTFRGTSYGAVRALSLQLGPSYLDVMLSLREAITPKTISTVERLETATGNQMRVSTLAETFLPTLPTVVQLRKLVGKLLGNVRSSETLQTYLQTSDSDSTPQSDGSSEILCPEWNDSRVCVDFGSTDSPAAGKLDPYWTPTPKPSPSHVTSGGTAIKENPSSCLTTSTSLMSDSEDSSNTGLMRTRTLLKSKVRPRRSARLNLSSPVNTPLSKYGKTQRRESLCCAAL